MTIHWCSSIRVRFAIANYRRHGDANNRSAWPYKLYDSCEDFEEQWTIASRVRAALMTDRRQDETGSGQTVATLNDLIRWLG